MEHLLNQSQHVFVLFSENSSFSSFGSANSILPENFEKPYTRLNSPIAVTVAVLLVFLFSPMILLGNSLVLVAMFRFKRLRTPSNFLVMSLSISDLGIGLFMPIGVYIELGGTGALGSSKICLFSYAVAITLCSVSVLVMVAIAVDRFTSLARPLRYPNLITHTAVERYIIVFWAYSSLVGFTPFVYSFMDREHHIPEFGDCSFSVLVAKPVQLFMFCAVYGPSCLILLVCYGYVYFVARGHARAISEVRHSFHHTRHIHGSPARYGVALLITTGLFVLLWVPFQVCMLLDVFIGTNILSAWLALYLALPILASSAFNPWVYGYRNAELRSAVLRVVDDLLTAFGFTYRSNAQNMNNNVVLPSNQATVGDPNNSFINHVQRDYFSLKPTCDFLLVPIAKAESSGILSDNELPKIFCENSRILISTDRPGYLRTSRSMVESFAFCKGSDILIIKGSGKGMIHGSSIV